MIDKVKKKIYCQSLYDRNIWLDKLKTIAHATSFDDDYILNNEIGSGAFSKVYKCCEKNTHIEYAVKILNKNESPDSIKNEISILKLVRHPNIIHLKNIYENQKNIYIITDLEKKRRFIFIYN
uniref:Protein kinase domain-containing protein n=1 Tax=viral metagenome TaxID=1070528 RepID=A0A6C0AGH6_9ZZZZ